jgi:hypothetical protein
VCGGLGVGHGEDETGEAWGECGCVVADCGGSWLAGAGAVSGASWIGEGLADGGGIAEAGDGGAAWPRVTLDAAADGAAAAG